MIISISVKESDLKAQKAIEELQEYSLRHGMSFSFVAIDAIKKYNDKRKKDKAEKEEQ